MKMNEFLRSVFVEQPFIQSLARINFLLLLCVMTLCGVGTMLLYSAAGWQGDSLGSWSPWASQHLGRFAIFFLPMLSIAFLKVDLLYKFSLFFYVSALVGLLWVALNGHVGMGAQRWISLGFIRLQPSEFVKIFTIMLIAAWYHWLPERDINRPIHIAIAIAIVGLPFLLILKQPDLGTAAALLLNGAAIMFLAGVSYWWFLLAFICAIIWIPLAINFLLHEYQRQRILTFLNPEQDPLGSGYHILQSKIAIGSGGLTGKGYTLGTQSHLGFLPEKQTDFIFTILAEEFGFVGCMSVLAIWMLLFTVNWFIMLRAQGKFARLLAGGLSMNLATYVFINLSMISGLVPVVGTPIPFLSYGGSAMLAAMLSIGLLLCIQVNSNLLTKGSNKF